MTLQINRFDILKLVVCFILNYAIFAIKIAESSLEKAMTFAFLLGYVINAAMAIGVDRQIEVRKYRAYIYHIYTVFRLVVFIYLLFVYYFIYTCELKINKNISESECISLSEPNGQVATGILAVMFSLEVYLSYIIASFAIKLYHYDLILPAHIHPGWGMEDHNYSIRGIEVA